MEGNRRTLYYMSWPNNIWYQNAFAPSPSPFKLPSDGRAGSKKLVCAAPHGGHMDSPIDRSDVPRRRDVVFLFGEEGRLDGRQFRFEPMKSFLFFFIGAVMPSERERERGGSQ